MNVFDKFGLTLSLILFLIQIFKKDFLKNLGFIWILAVGGIFISGILISIEQYFFWKNDVVFKYAIPPYKDMSYFLKFVGMRFFVPWVLALIASLVLGFVSLWANKKYNERFFENEEIYLGSLGMFLVGWPGFLFYLILILFLGLSLSFIYYFKNRGRAPLYYFWLPAVIVIILVKVFILPKSFLDIFKIS